MNEGCGLRKHNQAAIRRVCKCGDAALNLIRVMHTDRTYLYPERRRRVLDGAKLANPRGICRVSKHRHPRYIRYDFFKQFQPFDVMVPGHIKEVVRRTL